MEEFKFLTDIMPGEIFWREAPNYIKLARLHPNLDYFLKDDQVLQFDIVDKITHKRVLVLEWTCHGDTIEDFEQRWQIWTEEI